jgi:hypothetical protein
MEQVTATINFIKIVLGSFEEDYHGEDKEIRRKSDLKLKIPLISNDLLLQEQLKGYVRLSEQELKDQLNKLQDEKNELQKEKNLLHEKELKLMTPTAGNYLLLFPLNELN